MNIEQYISENAIQKHFRHQDGLFLKLTNRFAIFVTQRYPKHRPDVYEWQLLSGHAAKIVMRGLEKDNANSVMKTALEKTAKYIASEKRDFDIANDVMQTLGLT